MSAEHTWQLPNAFYDPDIRVGLTVCRFELRTALTVIAGFGVVFARCAPDGMMQKFGLELQAEVRRLLALPMEPTFLSLDGEHSQQAPAKIGHHLEYMLQDIQQELLRIQRTVHLFQESQAALLTTDQYRWTHQIIESLNRLRSVVTMAREILVPRLTTP